MRHIASSTELYIPSNYYYYYYYYYRLLRHKGSTSKTCTKHWKHKTWKD